MNTSRKHTPRLTIEQKIILWAKGKIGKKVGRGQCWDLAEEALKNSGAKTSNDLGPVEADTDYVWGDQLQRIEDIQRGDILQIRNHVITTTTITTHKFSDGTIITTKNERTAKRGHHTAIARSMPDSNGVVKTYEQHVNGKDVVQKLSINTKNIPNQTVTSTSKIRNPETKKIETAQTSVTITVNVSGSIWAYRPIKK